jgi:hypothetical protein
MSKIILAIYKPIKNKNNIEKKFLPISMFISLFLCISFVIGFFFIQKIISIFFITFLFLFGKYDFIAKLRFNLLQKKIKIICKYLIL